MTSGIGMQGRSMRKKKTKKWRENATAMPMPMGIPIPIVSEPEQQPNAIGAAGGSEGLVNFPIQPQAWAIPQGRAQTPYYTSVLPPDSNSNNNDKDSEDEVEAPPMPTPMHLKIPHHLSYSNLSNPLNLLLNDHDNEHNIHDIVQNLFKTNLLPPPWTPSKSPLPLPPRDLFEDKLYRAELDIPRGREVLSAVYGYGGSLRGSGTGGLGGTGRGSVRGGETTRSKSTGLFGGAGGGLLQMLTGTRGRKKCQSKRKRE
ncbi:hypothetical protein F5880DRAFT_1510775 [Lentinula raphanica]|nr:hypothetical protein F5880DRAFT_1510775 [Lentinula raphanica]